MIKLVRFFNTLNIDTALGAVSFVFMVSTVTKVEVDFSIYLALSISVLSIYNLDHLIDAYRLKHGKRSFRHSFYQQFLKILILWQAFLLGLGLWVLFKLPHQLIVAGIIMCGAIALYFLVIFKSKSRNYSLREVVVALGYTCSVAIIPFMGSKVGIGMSFYFILLIIFLIALTNLWTFALFDVEKDEKQNHHSIARKVDTTRLLKMTYIVIIFALMVVIVYTIFAQSWMLGLSLLSIEIIYFVMLQYQSFFKQNDYYRLVGELILAMPGLVLIMWNAV